MHGTQPGALIAFEGVEGAGKSTQVERLREFLRERGHEVLATREPGGTPAGERIRELLLDAELALEPRTEALLFAAARAELVERVVRPALERGAVVLCDRCVDSSIAYQGVARGLGRDPVERVNDWATGGLIPDLVVLLRLDAASGLARRTGARDRIEAQELAFHQAVERTYLELAAEHPGRYLVVDASRPPDDLAAEIAAAVSGRLAGLPGVPP